MWKICNGCASNRKKYTTRRVAKLLPIIHRQRQAIIDKFGTCNNVRKMFAGLRFQNNQDVIDRLESADQKKIRKAGWDVAIRSALLDCMSADYYYTFEKDYGND